MAQSVTISQRELARIAGLAYEGETLKVMLCNVGTTGYDAETEITDWKTVELDEDEYAEYEKEIDPGAYNETTARYQMPPINAEFVADSEGSGYSYDRVVIYIDGEDYPHSVIEEDPNITIAPGQTQTYRLILATDD